MIINARGRPLLRRWAGATGLAASLAAAALIGSPGFAGDMYLAPTPTEGGVQGQSVGSTVRDVGGDHPELDALIVKISKRQGRLVRLSSEVI